MDKIFKYYLKKDESTFYYVDNGVVLTSLEPIEQIHYPEGWMNSEVSLKRDMKYWGIVTQFGETIDFVLESAKILRYIRYTEGFEGNCILYIEALNTTTTQYEFYYQGDLDFSTAQDGKDTFSINVMERGISEVLASREDTTVEITLNDPDAVTLSLDGVLVRGEGDWYPGNYSSAADNGVRVSAIPYNDDFTTTFGRAVSLSTADSVDQIYPFIRPHGQLSAFGATGNPRQLVEYAADPGNPTEQDGIYVLYANTELKDVRVSGFMEVAGIMPDLAGTKTIRVIATVVDLDLPGLGIVSQTILNTYTSTLQNTDFGYLADMQGSFDMPAGSYLSVTIVGTTPLWDSGDPSPEAYFAVENGSFKVSFLGKVPQSDAKGFHYIDLLKKVVTKISDGESTVISDFLSSASTGTLDRFNNWDTSPLWQIMTCGNALRGLPGSVIKTSVSELYSDLWSNMMLALSVHDNNIKIEPLSSVLDKNYKIATIHETAKMNVVDFTDKIFNNLKVGYGSYDNKNVVGKNEFNTGLEFIAEKVKRLKKEENEISEVRADVYGIESVRAETLGDERLDNRSDNDTFKIEVDPVPVSGKYKVYRPSGSISGVDDPSNIYNVTLSPGRALRRHLSFYRSLIRKGKLVFQTTDKNPSLVSTFGAGTVVEIEDINVEPDVYMGHDAPRLFLPYIFEFDCAPPFNLYNLAINNPNGYLEFDYYGTMMKGFILELSMVPAKGSCKCRLLSHPLNDESKLIR